MYRPSLRAFLSWLVVSFCLLPCYRSSDSAYAAEKTLKMASFNIQVFGPAKVSKPIISQTLLSILERYDLVFIQEIRDNENTAIHTLLARLRAKTSRDFKLRLSERLGRGEMKEQYAYIYDAAKVEALDSYVFDDKDDHFEREPFVGHFEADGLEFSIAGIHITPTDVMGELSKLNGVYRDVKARYADGNIFVLGDFNADCSYYKAAKGFDYFDVKPALLLADEEDTTVGATNCAYDRVLGFGSLLAQTSMAKAYNFSEEMGIDLANAKLVSDHYPIEFSIHLGSKGDDDLLPLRDEDEDRVQAESEDGVQYKTVDEADDDRDETLPPVLIGPVCGIENYLSPKGYCMGQVGSKRRRVAGICCPIEN
jgi:deoxyribonuclease-1-like protein